MARQRLPQKPQLLDYEDVMELLCCTRSAIKRLIERDKIPPPHHVDGIGARWFEDEIYDYLTELRAARIAEKRVLAREKKDASGRK